VTRKLAVAVVDDAGPRVRITLELLDVLRWYRVEAINLIKMPNVKRLHIMWLVVLLLLGFLVVANRVVAAPSTQG